MTAVEPELLWKKVFKKLLRFSIKYSQSDIFYFQYTWSYLTLFYGFFMPIATSQIF